MTRLAIKVDVDTFRGYTEGVPRLLALFRQHRLRVSIFFSFGPDNSGRAIRRIFRRGFLAKMIRTKAPSTYGLKTLLYGTLLPAPLIVPAAPDIVVQALEDGHDIGIHAWDHVYVQDYLERISKTEYLALFCRAKEIFVKLCGMEPRSIAAPGWQVTETVLEAEEELGLCYASDTRGFGPFRPSIPGRVYHVPQIPTTLPTMDEIWGLPGINEKSLPQYWMAAMNREWNVLTVHAEMEGLSKLGVFEKFLDMAEAAGTDFFTLDDYTKLAPLPEKMILKGKLPGRAGFLAIEGGFSGNKGLGTNSEDVRNDR